MQILGMKIEDLKNKKVVVFGLGVEGFSTARFLDENGVKFTIAEKKDINLLPYDVQDFIKSKNIPLIHGQSHAESLMDFDVVIRNPGIPLWNLNLVEAVKQGREVTSHVKLFFDLCPCPIIGVTGTKGKGTTSSLIYEMIRAGDKDVYLGGNIGRPPLDFLKDLSKDSLVVLELSSFQLEDLKRGPHVAVVLMVTQEHLDSNAPDSPNYHKCLNDYLEAKKNLVRFQSDSDFAVINYDYEQSREFANVTKAKKLFVSVTRELKDGAFLRNDELVLNVNGEQQVICERHEVFLRGEHNLQNILAAASASTLAGAKLQEIRQVIKSFKGLEHRLEFVREVDGVKYYNDSFSTTPETVMAAIKSFKEPEIIILGGSEKGSDYSELGRVVARAKNIKAVILIGKTAQKIKSEIDKNNPLKSLVFVVDLETMNGVVQRAAQLSEPGDVVILTPACASFDMFKNYKDRGQQFRNAVNKL